MLGELSAFVGGFLAVSIFKVVVEFGKNANSATIMESYAHIVVFVWRQLEFAFFGALTSVGALFILPKILTLKKENRQCLVTTTMFTPSTLPIFFSPKKTNISR